MFNGQNTELQVRGVVWRTSGPQAEGGKRWARVIGNFLGTLGKTFTANLLFTILVVHLQCLQLIGQS